MKYICSICSHIYDEEKETVKFKDLPNDWKCPKCGAPKSLFKPLEEKEKSTENFKKNIIEEETLEKLSIGQLAALCSNLARGCQKQYKFEEEELFQELAVYFSSITPEVEDARIEKLSDMIMSDIDEKYVNANIIANEKNDRGAKRALAWGEKVSRILKSLVDRYLKEKETMLEDTEIWLCTICGFIYIGKLPPEKCPVCKVTGLKFEKIEEEK